MLEDYNYEAFDEIAETFTTDTKVTLLSKYKTDGKSTHTFLNGGKLNIPYDKLPEVYSLLEENKENPPLAERINAYGDAFKFYIDLDDEIADVKQLLLTTDKAFADLYNLNDIKYTIWKNSNKQKFHIIYQLKTTLEQALLIVEYVDNIFLGDIDFAVYKSGLRLPLCNKDTVQKQDNSIYEYFGGHKGSYLDTGSILDITDLPNIEYTEKAKGFLNSGAFKESKAYKMLHKSIDEAPSRTIDDNKLNEVLNKMFEVSYNWKAVPSGNGFKLTHDGKLCLVNNAVEHSDIEHSSYSSINGRLRLIVSVTKKRSF